MRGRRGGRGVGRLRDNVESGPKSGPVRVLCRRYPGDASFVGSDPARMRYLLDVQPARRYERLYMDENGGPSLPFWSSGKCFHVNAPSVRGGCPVSFSAHLEKRMMLQVANMGPVSQTNPVTGSQRGQLWTTRIP